MTYFQLAEDLTYFTIQTISTPLIPSFEIVFKIQNKCLFGFLYIAEHIILWTLFEPNCGSGFSYKRSTRV